MEKEQVMERLVELADKAKRLASMGRVLRSELVQLADELEEEMLSEAMEEAELDEELDEMEEEIEAGEMGCTLPGCPSRR
jgi:hypothetical protein